MALTDAYQRLKGRQRGGGQQNIADLVFGPQIQTQPGDPDFSPSQFPSSQGQYPAAAAEQRLFENQRRAQNAVVQARAAGVDVTQPQFDRLTETAEEGFLSRALTMGESLIGWLDGPRQAVNLLIQDLVGGEAESGFENPNFLDYWDAFFGGIDDSEGFELRTGLDPTSGSTTLDMFGWEKPENFLGQVGRGIAHFAFDVGIDPLTYVTFGLSGLGKKVAARTGKLFTDNVVQYIKPKFLEGTLDDFLKTLPEGSYLREIGSNIDNIITEFDDDLAKMAAENGGRLPQHVLDSMNENLLDDVGNKVELALRQRIGKDVLQPLVARDFAAIPENALEMLPMFARGGVRVSVPFTSGRLGSFFDDAGRPIKGGAATLQRGIQVPGTRGLGRDLIGDRVRNTVQTLRDKFPTFNKLAKELGDGVTISDWDGALLRALRRGDIEPWQYNLASEFTDATANMVTTQEIASLMNVRFKEVSNLVADTQWSEQDVFAAVLDTLERADPDDAYLRAFEDVFGNYEPVGAAAKFSDSKIQNKVEEIATEMRQVFDSYIDAIAEIDPSIKTKYLRGRVPHVLEEDTVKVLVDLAGTTGTGKPDGPGQEMLALILEAIGRGGRAMDQVGGSSTMRAMQDDAVSTMAAVTLIDHGQVLFDQQRLSQIEDAVRATMSGGAIDPEALAKGRLPITRLNELIGPEVEALARKNNISLPKNWSGKVFDENPLHITLGFVEDMRKAIQGMSMVRTLQDIGLAASKKSGLDVQDMIRAIHTRLVRNVSKSNLSGVAVPKETQTTAPVEWLSNFLNPHQQRRMAQQTDNFAKLGNGQMASKQAFTEDIAERGIRDAVIVRVDPDGYMLIEEGNHRIAAAMDASVDEAPVKYFLSDEPIPKDLRSGRINRRFLREDIDRPMRGDAHEVFKVNPWQPQAFDDAKPLLSGYKGAKEAVNNQTVRAMNRRGIYIGEGGRQTTDVRNLYDQVVNTSTDDLLDNADKVFDYTTTEDTWRIVADSFPERGTQANVWEKVGDNYVFYDKNKQAALTLEFGIDSKGRPIVYENTRPGLSQIEKRNAFDEAGETFDKVFGQNGVWEGRITNSDFQALLNETGVDKEFARGLHRYFKQTFDGLPEGAKNFLGPDAPPELVGTKVLFDAFEDGVNDLMRWAGAVRTPEGALAFDPDQLKLIGDDVFAAKVKELQKVANKLAENGHAAAANVMRGIDKAIPAQTIEGFVNPELFKLAGPALKDTAVQREMALWMRQLTQNMNTIYTPGGIASLKHATNSVLKWWRAMATIARPSFHIRNLVGGVWNNMIIGVGPEDYLMVKNNALTLRKALKEGLSFEEALERLPQKVRPYFEAARAQDVLNGFSTTEFREILMSQRKNALQLAKVWDVDNFALTQMGASFMEGIEDYLRMSAFVRWYDPADPSTAKIAKEMVEAVHFNYTNLTPFETNVKKVIPFFVWQRRNIPLQISLMLENPVMINRYTHMMDALSENFSASERSELPLGDNFTAFAAGTKWHVNEGTPFWARVVIDPDLPVRDLVDLPWPTPEGIADFAQQVVGPHVTAIFDLNGERDFGDVNAPAPFNGVLRSLAAVGLYDTTTEGDVRIPYMYRSAIETAFPFLRETIDPLTGGPSDPNRQQRLGISEDDGFFESSAKTLMATLGRGLGFKFNSPADIRGSAARQREELDALIRELRLQGELPPSPG